jgi:hypothetical protein
VCQTLDHDETGLQAANIQGLECLEDDRLRFVRAKAEQTSNTRLDAILGRQEESSPLSSTVRFRDSGCVNIYVFAEVLK